MRIIKLKSLLMEADLTAPVAPVSMTNVNPAVAQKLTSLDMEISKINKEVTDTDAKMTPFLKKKADLQKKKSDLEKEKTRLGGKQLEEIITEDNKGDLEARTFLNNLKRKTDIKDWSI